MQLTLQIVITDESGLSRTEELMTLQKSGYARNDIGLSVSESKQLLNTVQQSVVQLQADEYTHNHIQCPRCASDQRSAENTVSDTVWHYSCIGASGVQMPLRGVYVKNRQSGQ
ncbi:Uncharacterised protein [Yersinia wautersii]|uniref:Uncharacterized protein n=1 Tax=Yersinia wautersii TaxID=1341643 RepID=A0ABM9THG6_9GAMM|nr:Uncharacterised protein [Yersinia wautersii]